MRDEHLPFHQMIKAIEFILRFSGVNIRSGVTSPSDVVKSRIVFITNNLSLHLGLWGEICWLINGIISGYDITDLTYNAPCVLLTLLSLSKGTLFILNEKLVHELLDKLRKMEKREEEREQTSEKLKMVDNEKNFLQAVLKSISRLYVAVIVSFSLMPVLIMYLNYTKTRELELVLPFLIWYPFDQFNMKVYPLIYLHQVWDAIIVILYICSTDYIFFTCCTYLRIQFKLLQGNIENLIPFEKDMDWTFSYDDEFKEKFRELSMWHQDLIKTTLLLEEIYSKSALLNFLTSSLVICLTGFNVMMVDEVVIVMSFLSFLMMSLFQVFFICFFADLLSVASGEVSAAVYKSQWYMADSKVAKQLHLIQTRAHKPCKLTAFGFADVNLNSFMRVLSTSWSYFALLKKLYE